MNYCRHCVLCVWLSQKNRLDSDKTKMCRNGRHATIIVTCRKRTVTSGDCELWKMLMAVTYPLVSFWYCCHMASSLVQVIVLLSMLKVISHQQVWSVQNMVDACDVRPLFAVELMTYLAFDSPSMFCRTSVVWLVWCLEKCRVKGDGTEVCKIVNDGYTIDSIWLSQ